MVTPAKDAHNKTGKKKMHEFSSSYKEFSFINKSWLGEFCTFCGTGSLLMQHQHFGWRSEFDHCFCFGDVCVASLLSFFCCSSFLEVARSVFQRSVRFSMLPATHSPSGSPFFSATSWQLQILSYGIHIPTPLCN